MMYASAVGSLASFYSLAPLAVSFAVMREDGNNLSASCLCWIDG